MSEQEHKENNVEATINAVTGLAKAVPIYDDVVQPAAKEVGKLIAKRALDKKIESVVYDRGGYIYHGVVKELAEAAREAGLKF